MAFRCRCCNNTKKKKNLTNWAKWNVPPNIRLTYLCKDCIDECDAAFILDKIDGSWFSHAAVDEEDNEITMEALSKATWFYNKRTIFGPEIKCQKK